MSSVLLTTGQDNYGKAAVVTKLLGTQLLPLSGTPHLCNCSKSENIGGAESSFSAKEELKSNFQSFLPDTSCNKPIGCPHVGSSKKRSCCHVAPVKVMDGLYMCSACSRFVPPNNCDEQSCIFPHSFEKPWRGIRISYSSSQITYSVVRPDSKTSSPGPFIPEIRNTEHHLASVRDKATGVGHECPSSDTHIFDKDALSESKNNVTIDNENVKAQITTDPHVSIESKTCIKSVPTSSATWNSLSAAGALKLDDLTVEGLERLLDLKLRSLALEQQKSRVEEVVANDQKSKIIVKEVPLSELELGSLHLKVNISA